MFTMKRVGTQVNIDYGLIDEFQLAVCYRYKSLLINSKKPTGVPIRAKRSVTAGALSSQ